MLRRLTELGMNLAEAAAEKAQMELATTEPPENQAEPAKPSGPAITFTRLARCVRQCIALEASIAAEKPARPLQAPPAAMNDPRRAPIRRMFDEVTGKNPEAQTIRREAENLLDRQLEADPDQTTTMLHLFDTIAAELGLDFDPGRLSNRSLQALCPGAGPAGAPEAGKPKETLLERLERRLAVAAGGPTGEADETEEAEAYTHSPSPITLYPEIPPPSPPPLPPPKHHPLLPAYPFHQNRIVEMLRAHHAP